MRGYLLVDDLIEPISRATLNGLENCREKSEIKKFCEENGTLINGTAQWDSENADPLRDIKNVVVRFRGY